MSRHDVVRCPQHPYDVTIQSFLDHLFTLVVDESAYLHKEINQIT